MTGCAIKHNPFASLKTQMDNGNHAVNVKAAIITKNGVKSFLLMFLSQLRMAATDWLLMSPPILDHPYPSMIKEF